jgi:hypothetical protein
MPPVILLARLKNKHAANTTIKVVVLRTIGTIIHATAGGVAAEPNLS